MKVEFSWEDSICNHWKGSRKTDKSFVLLAVTCRSWSFCFKDDMLGDFSTMSSWFSRDSMLWSWNSWSLWQHGYGNGGSENERPESSIRDLEVGSLCLCLCLSKELTSLQDQLLINSYFLVRRKMTQTVRQWMMNSSHLAHVPKILTIFPWRPEDHLPIKDETVRSTIKSLSCFNNRCRSLVFSMLVLILAWFYLKVVH